MSGLILIVEDERELARALEYNLRREGYRTEVAFDGAEALARALGGTPPDLVLLDVMLPGLSGAEVCRRLKDEPRTRHVPVLMLTARTDEADRVLGFEAGADDYVSKPFSVRELLLRVRAILRRTNTDPTGDEPGTFGRLEIDPEGHLARVDARDANLTALEFRLLQALFSNRGRVLSRKRLLEDVWGIRADVTTRTVDTHVKRLRQKLGPAGEYIETLRGVGYKFRTAPHGDDA